MGLTDSIIETGVDKLVNLINLKGKLSSDDAAKEIGVSATVIMEWADFLEEEGIVKIEYKFTTPYIVSSKITKKDLQEKAKEFSGKKEGFIRKAEVSISFLNREAGKLNKIKEEFDKIKKDLGFDINSIKKELEDLEKYEKLKIGLDKQIQKQKDTSMDKFESMANQILMEKKKYDDILEGIKEEKKELEKEKLQARSLEGSEKIIREKLNSLRSFIDDIDNKVQKEEGDVKISEEHIQKLALMAENIKSNVEKEKSLIEPLVKKSREQSKKIKELQDRVTKKIAEKEKKLTGTKKASKKIKDFFQKKTTVIDFIEKINKDRNDLQGELTELIRKAKSFQLSSKSADVVIEIMDIEKKFKEVDAKKKLFEKDLKKLNSFFK